jgi:4-hydroxybenzoyl-CoA thioesterase
MFFAAQRNDLFDFMHGSLSNKLWSPLDMRNNSTRTASSVFSEEILVRFADCDPAGIVFYPRYFQMFSNLVEDWCASGLGISFREMHMEKGFGLPTVHLETDFVKVSELGELLRAELSVLKLGGASVTVAIRLCGPDGEDRVRATLVLVWLDSKRRRAMPIPDEYRAKIMQFMSFDHD